jgi:hypothetical protein
LNRGIAAVLSSYWHYDVLQALLGLGRLGRLEQEDGTPADPPTLKAAVPNWRAGDTIPLGERTLRVVDVR